ncbi:MAG: hypothetical protein PHO70_00965 [Candidatus Omnitrophica bacterium]|nr:hypothetical protein [Candidatus Omnitrophota bacterium]
MPIEKDNSTPEEKLLKIIENPQSTEKNMEVPPERAKKQFNLKDFVAGLKTLQGNKNLSQFINLRTANKIIIVFCGILTIFFILDFIKLGANSKKRLEQVKAEAAIYETKDDMLKKQEANITDTIALAKKHNIFTYTPSAPVGTPPKIAPEMGEIVSSLKLVGILWSDKPQAMIEDSKDQKTYLLSTGDQLKQLFIKKILKEKVILGKDQLEWELR